MKYDFAVLGGGSSGYAAARTAADLGLKTVVIEGGREVGGLCILRGCMPSKTLIESANRFQAIGQAAEFGLTVSGRGFDAGAIVARKKKLIGEFADYRREQLETGRFDFLRGTASFRDPHTLEVDLTEGGQQTLSVRSTLIATGSVINSPPVPGLKEADALKSDDVLDLETLPQSLIVLGAGPVALEMAHYFSALGCRVTIIQRSGQLLKGVDADVAGVVEDAFRKRGMEIFTNTSLVRIEREGALRRVVFTQDGKEHAVEADALLNGLGRRPNTDGLGLEHAGVERQGATVTTAATQQTNVSGIFAAGDCTGPFEVVHIAIEQGELAARNAARVVKNDPDLESIDYRLKLYAVFTEPQVAAVGLSEIEAREQGLDVLPVQRPRQVACHGGNRRVRQAAGRPEHPGDPWGSRGGPPRIRSDP